jgi:hypothetical protein
MLFFRRKSSDRSLNRVESPPPEFTVIGDAHQYKSGLIMCQAKPSQAKPSQAKPSQAKPSQAKLSQAKLPCLSHSILQFENAKYAFNNAAYP